MPKLAEVTAEDENSVTLKFKDGFSGKFYPNSTFKFRTFEVKLTTSKSAAIPGKTSEKILKVLSSYWK